MEKKELIKGFKIIVEDLLDNFDKYTDEEKAQVKELFVKASELNAILDKYDVDLKIDWQEYYTIASQCLGTFQY